MIGDFGLARLVQGGNLGGVMRTWKWLPPEAFNIHNTQYDQRADIYSYGIFLWELATLTIPFDEYSKHPKYSINGNVVVLTIKKAIIDEDLRPSIPNDTLASYSQLIHKCWQRDPSKRPHPEQIIKQLIWILTSEYGKDAIPGDHDADDEFSLDLSHSNSNNSNDSSLLESSHHNSGDELNHLSSSSSTQLQVKHNLFVVQKNEHVDVASILPLVQMSFEETITSMIVVKNHMWIATLKGNIIVAKLSLEVSPYFLKIQSI